MGELENPVPKGQVSRIRLTLFCMGAAFITYCSMYAFRNPVAAGIYDGLSLWGVDYKTVLLSAQVIGYMTSKFIGISVISSLQRNKRGLYIILFITFSWLSLLAFAISPPPWNFVFLFFNGLPLGMIWGLVFSFLEGRRNTELLGAGLCVSFIVSSGLVKAVGKYLVESFQVSEFWMPCLTGLAFLPPLLLGVWMLEKIPDPDEEDRAMRTDRTPMNKTSRAAFFKKYAPGIILLVLVYMAITVFRDIRDNFAVEIWSLLGYGQTPSVLITTEIPVSVAVFSGIALMVVIRSNRSAFYLNLLLICLAGGILIASTLLHQQALINPVLWMTMTGTAMYLAYISFNTLLFERWMAFFKEKGNVGFLMYLADSFGYMASVGILFLKNFSSRELNWLEYISNVSLVTGALSLLLTLGACFYFLAKERGLRTSA